MTGAALIKDMVNVNRSNRVLLRGDQTAKFRNFDLEAYQNKPSHFRKAVYKEATPTYLKSLHNQLVKEKVKEDKMRQLLLLSAIGSVAIAWMIIFSI